MGTKNLFYTGMRNPNRPARSEYLNGAFYVLFAVHYTVPLNSHTNKLLKKGGGQNCDVINSASRRGIPGFNFRLQDGET